MAGCDARTINAGRHGPGGARNLTRETGTLDSLGSLLDLVLVAAAVSGDHLTRPRLHVHCGKPETRLSPSDTDRRNQSSARAQKHEAIRNASEVIIDFRVTFYFIMIPSSCEEKTRGKRCCSLNRTPHPIIEPETGYYKRTYVAYCQIE